MNREEAENLVRSIFPGVTILPSSSRSDYDSDEAYAEGMKKHNELAEISKMWNADKPSREEW